MDSLNAALRKAEALNASVSITIVDIGGRMIHMAHMDNAPLQSREIALNKARTAVGFGVSTSQWTERLQRCSPAVQQGLPLQPGMALFGGGEPFILDGQVIGAVGVSGASEAMDTQCAQAAIEHAQTLLQG
ncbi:heme-binding protein [Pseudomonas sp. NMI542_15]|nr:heme-binding protein [Pseudomonas sp. NMI542_15]